MICIHASLRYTQVYERSTCVPSPTYEPTLACVHKTVYASTVFLHVTVGSKALRGTLGNIAFWALKVSIFFQIFCHVLESYELRISQKYIKKIKIRPPFGGGKQKKSAGKSLWPSILSIHKSWFWRTVTLSHYGICFWRVRYHIFSLFYVILSV